MLLAINVGNTNTVAGLWSQGEWLCIERRPTLPASGYEEFLSAVMGQFVIPRGPEAVAVASVVPAADGPLGRAAREVAAEVPVFLRGDLDIGIPVRYDPPESAGADRLANALGALARYSEPVIVVDFGTATTIDLVDGGFRGGAILPGAATAARALLGGTAQLPEFDLAVPDGPVGSSTAECLQVGAMLGHACAVDGLVRRMSSTLREPATVLATGGLAAVFMEACETLERLEPNLTLDGLAAFAQRGQGGGPR